MGQAYAFGDSSRDCTRETSSTRATARATWYVSSVVRVNATSVPMLTGSGDASLYLCGRRVRGSPIHDHGNAPLFDEDSRGKLDRNAISAFPRQGQVSPSV